MKIFLALLMVGTMIQLPPRFPTLLMAENQQVTARVEMISPAIYPDTYPHIRFTAEVKGQVGMVVLVVPILRHMTADLHGANGACFQADASQPMVCDFFNPSPGDKLVADVTLDPEPYFPPDITQPCDSGLFMGVQAWAAVDGEQLIPEGSKVWARFSQAHCQILPFVQVQ